MKTRMKNVTIIIPVRLDSIIRLENLVLTIKQITDNFITNIVIIESGKYRNGIIETLLSKYATYIFVEDYDPIFYRTKFINDVVRNVKTEIIGVWDADIILDAEQIYDSVLQLKSGFYDVAYPYDGRFYDISDILRDYYIETRDIEFLKTNTNKMNLLYITGGNKANAVGGAFLINRRMYEYAGYENEAFYGWGTEDGERYYRFVKLGLKIFRCASPLFHLSHPRDINGGINIPRYFLKRNSNIMRFLGSSTIDEFMKYIRNGLKFEVY